METSCQDCDSLKNSIVNYLENCSFPDEFFLQLISMLVKKNLASLDFLYSAVRQNSYKIIEALIDAGMPVNVLTNQFIMQKSNNKYESLLHFFAESIDSRVAITAKLLKDKGYIFDLTFKNRVGLTCLERALIRGSRPNFIFWLIHVAQEKNIKIESLLEETSISSLEGSSELSAWIAEGHMDNSEALIYNYIRYLFKNQLCMPSSIECIAKLLEVKPSLKEKIDSTGKTLLDRIMENKNLSENRELIKLFKQD